MAGEKISGQNSVFDSAALYLSKNGYELDYPATKQVKEKYAKPNAEMAIFKNPSNGKFACLEVGKDNSYVALNTVRETINGLTVGAGGRVQAPLEKMALPGGLEKRLDGIAKDFNLVSTKDLKRVSEVEVPPETRKLRRSFA